MSIKFHRIGTACKNQRHPVCSRCSRLQCQTNGAILAEQYWQQSVCSHCSKDFATFFVAVKMPIPSAVSLLMAPMHLLAYSTLLGTELYQSFIMTKVAYQALPRSAFTSLQKRVFPIYFRGQSSLLVFVALTIPPGPMSMFCSRNDWIPLAVAGGTAALNLLVYGPKTQKLMIERAHQGVFYALHANLTNIVSNTRLDTCRCGRNQCCDEASQSVILESTCDEHPPEFDDHYCDFVLRLAAVYEVEF